MVFDMKLCVKCGVHAAVLATALVASAAYVQDPAAETFSGIRQAAEPEAVAGAGPSGAALAKFRLRHAEGVVEWGGQSRRRQGSHSVDA